jgi:DNA polymerase-4
VFQGLNKHKLQGKTITIKVKYTDFTQVTRSKTLAKPITQTMALTCVPKLLGNTDAGKRPVRLVGLTISSFEQVKHQENELQLGLGIQ